MALQTGRIARSTRPSGIPLELRLLIAAFVTLAVATGTGVAASAFRESASAAVPLAVPAAAPLPPESRAHVEGEQSRVAPPAKALERWRDERILLVDPKSWDDPSRRAAQEALALLPASIRAQLGNPALGPLYISVNSEGRNLSGDQPYGRAANFYSTNDGLNEVVLYPQQSLRTALHELGHAYNLRHMPAGSYAHVFLDREMLSFLDAAGWRVLTPPERLRELSDHAQVAVEYRGARVWSPAGLSRDDPLEDFANSFALFFAAPQELQRLSPARYAWFARQFGAE